MHLVVGTGHSGQVKVAHPAQLQLEGQGRLQVAINPVFCKLIPRSEREELGEFSLLGNKECDSSESVIHKDVLLGLYKGTEDWHQRLVLHVVGTLDGHIQDVDGFLSEALAVFL